jgi:hypothetical protein
MRVVAKSEAYWEASGPTRCDARFRDAILVRHKSVEGTVGVEVRVGGVMSETVAC